MMKAIDVMHQINSHFGEGTVRLGSDKSLEITCLSTGVFPIDMLFDGGLPRGRFVDVYGDFSTLKSFIALKAVAAVQHQGGMAAYVDTEHAYDPHWAFRLGVDTSDLILQWPPTGEDAIAVMEVLLRSGVDLIVWDSIAATMTKQQAEKRPGDDNQPASQARMMSAGLRRLNTVNRTTAVLCLNQTRVNVGMTFGPKETAPGGKALPFYASYRVRLTKAGKDTEDVEVWTGDEKQKAKMTVGQKIKATLEKSKLSAPTKEVWFTFDLKTGEVDETGYIIGWAIENGYVEVKANGVYVVGDQTIRGRDKFKVYMENNPEVITWMKEQMTEGWRVSSTASVGSPSPQGRKTGGRRKSSS